MEERPKFELQCPVENTGGEIITLGHGSGGRLTARLLSDHVFSAFHNEFLDKRHDGAVFEANGRLAFSTDSYVVSPVFFPGGNIGDLAVNGTVNDLAMCGAMARYLSLSFILEEGLHMDDFRTVVQTIKKAADDAGVIIITGDTKVVEKGKGDQIFINTTGIGFVHPKSRVDAARIAPGDRVLVSGTIANHGIAIMSVRQGLEFETTIGTDCTHLNYLVASLLDRFGEDIHVMRVPTRGGVASVLNEISEQTGFEIQIEQAEIPLAEEVEGACEMLGLDPLYVANEGIFICFVQEAVANDVLQLLRSDPKGKNAAIIGKVTDVRRNRVVMDSKIGGKRVVNSLPGEQLPRIC